MQSESLNGNSMRNLDPRIRQVLKAGTAIPAHPLALDANGKLDERRQRALCRYYVAAGAGGLAVGVHTTQFQIRDPAIGLFLPLLDLVREELDRLDPSGSFLRIGGICGATSQAVCEAEALRQR